jgi:hypothetical protein
LAKQFNIKKYIYLSFSGAGIDYYATDQFNCTAVDGKNNNNNNNNNK